MSSLRNAVKRKEHRERQQPSARQKLGLLEKKKDYRERADDFHKKREAIRLLLGKAAEKNPDEFYFAMEKERTDDGVHKARSAAVKTYTHDQLALMRTQDVAYMRRAIQAEKKEKLQNSLHFLGVAEPKSHKVFVDDIQMLMSEFSELQNSGLMRRRSEGAGSVVCTEDNATGADMSDSDKATISKAIRASYEELAMRARRLDQLRSVLAHLERQQLLVYASMQSKGRKSKVPMEGTSRSIHRWKRERKK